jgi:hypothetical protein
VSSLKSQWAEILVAPRVEEVEGEPLVLIISDRYLNQAIGTCCTDNGHLFVSKHVKDLITRFAPAERPMNAIAGAAPPVLGRIGQDNCAGAAT